MEAPALPSPASATPHRLRTAVLVNLAAVLERCDEQMLPAVYRFIGASWDATPTQLGYITLCRALVQALSSPIGGIAGHLLHRGRVVGAGCLLWASCTAAFALCTSLAAGAAVWAVNGLGLALVLPSAQSLIADLFAAVQRGRAFGMLYCAGAFGGMAGALFATNMGSHRPLGLEGWRVAFLCLAAVSAAAGAANLLLTEDPLREQQNQQEKQQWGQQGLEEEQQQEQLLAVSRKGFAELEGLESAAAAETAEAPAAPAGDDEAPAAGEDASEQQLLQRVSTDGDGSGRGRQPPPLELAGKPAAGTHAWRDAAAAGGPCDSGSQAPLQAASILTDVAAVLRIPTFLLIVVQGIAGSIPWSALVFLTLYLQLCGMSDAQASALVALFLAGTAVGGLIGGCVGDVAAKHWPNHGRIAITQFSVSIGIPFAFLVFKGLPRNGQPATVALYAAVLLTFALLKAWPAPACNHPVFAEIVPPQQRNLVYAFDRCFEGAVASCAAPLVGVLAEQMFGFSGSGTVTHDRERDLANAAALGSALLAFLVVPWCFTLTMYTGLHWTYPADKAAALRRQCHALMHQSRGLEEPGVVCIDRLSIHTASSVETSIELSPAASAAPAAPGLQGELPLQAGSSDALGRLTVLAGELGSSPTPEQLEQLRSAAAAALAVARGQSRLGAVQAQSLWKAACNLWNASLALAAADGNEAGNAAADGQRATAVLLQAACDLCSPLPPGSLAQDKDVVSLVRFYHRAGTAWAALGEFEAAEAALARGAEAAAALQPLCFQQPGRGPLQQEAAELVFSLQLERLQVAMRLDQQMLCIGLVSQAQAFAADRRLPSHEGMGFRMRLVRALHSEGQQLAQAHKFCAAGELLSTAYESLTQLDMDLEGEDSELAAAAAEAHATGASVLALLAFCRLESGEAEQAQNCLQALRQLADAQAAAHFATCFLSLRVLLQLGRLGEAEAELLNLVSHEEATPEACLAGLQAALAARGGVSLARSALSVVLERFADEPGLAVGLARSALGIAATAAGSGPSKVLADRADASAAAAAADAAAEAEELVLEVVGDERVMERVCEEVSLRRELLGLLWNHAVQHVGAMHSRRAGEAALAFFSAALPLLEVAGAGAGTQAAQEGGQAEEGLSAVECRRAQALCCLGARQFDRALEFLEAADQLQPGSVPTAMLRLSVQLEAGSQDGAAASVAALAGCSHAEPDALRIACIQAMDAGASGAARQALLCLLERCRRSDNGGEAESSPGSAAGAGILAPGYEAVVFQNLIHLLLADGAAGRVQATAANAPSGGAASAPQTLQEEAAAGTRHSSELARLFDLLVERMRAVGPSAFFMQQEGRSMQQEWFAQQSWNAGQQLGAAGERQQAAVLLAVCGELYAALPAPTPATLHRQKMAFLLAAAVTCDVSEEQAAAEQAAAAAVIAAAVELGLGEAGAPTGAPSSISSGSSLALAQSYLQQARSAAAGLQAQLSLLGTEGQQQVAGDPKSDVFLLLLDFKLSWLSGDVAGQLDALKRAQALPAFGAEHFLRAAAWARSDPQPGGRERCVEVCRCVEEARLQRLSQQTPMDCGAVLASLRGLVEMTPGDAEKLGVLQEASGLMSAMPAGALPPMEVRWLVSTAWNRGAVHSRFGRHAEAERYKSWAVGALRYADATLVEQYRDEMQASLMSTRNMAT